MPGFQKALALRGNIRPVAGELQLLGFQFLRLWELTRTPLLKGGNDMNFFQAHGPKTKTSFNY